MTGACIACGEPATWQNPVNGIWACEACRDLYTPRRSYLDPVDLLGLMAAEPPDEEWLVEPLLPARKHVGIVAARGTGKSLLALDVAARRATGQPVLDQPSSNPIHVVYLDLEMGPDDLYERLADLGWTVDNPLFGNLVDHLHYYQLVDLPPLDTQAGGEALEEIVDDHRADLVVIDTVSRVISDNENSNDTFRELFRHTETRLKRKGVTLARLDHLGKDVTKGSRGASSKEDALDVVWQLTESGAGILTLKLTKGRQAWLPPAVSISRNTENGILSHVLPTVPVGDWLVELVDEIDALGVPVDAGIPTVQKALQAAGRGRRRDVISKAVRFRKGRARSAYRVGNTPGTPIGTPDGNTGNTEPAHQGNNQQEQALFADNEAGTPTGTPRNRQGGVFPSIGGNTPNPPAEPVET